jgi:poly-gamma-glutamate capsule biosynthesis protein CapA/YwtB (metallophosphatase superfamily)
MIGEFMNAKKSQPKKPINLLLNIIPVIFITAVLFIPLSLYACSLRKDISPSSQNQTTPAKPVTSSAAASATESTDILKDSLSVERSYSLIHAQGNTLESRILTPEGFNRIPSDTNEFSAFMRGLSLKKEGSPVLLYNGEKKSNQDSHIAVFDFDVGDSDLQQCADSIIRVYSEYYWSLNQYDKIAFHLTNGFLMDYKTWRNGSRIQVNGNNVKWVKTKAYDDSYETFRSYLNMIYTYAGTLSLSSECKAIDIEEISPGDMFIQGGNPGHCVLVVDIAEDAKGKRCFLLAQGYMPAQEFHVLKNPLHPKNPWYYTSEISFPLATPSWNFKEGSLQRWSNFPLNESDNTAISDKSQVTIMAVGDNLIHLQIIQDGLKKNETYNFDSLYVNLKDEISSADLAVINQETILGGDDFEYSGYPAFNSPTEIGDAVINAGFDIVLHANNHTMDKGLKGIQNTLAYWKKHPEITMLGINKSKKAQNKIRIIKKNGIRLALLNYTYGLNGCKLPKDMPYLVNMLNKDQMSKDIKKAKEIADFTIVFPHWGSEYVYTPTRMQKDLTSFFYENGVDLVIGSHPHVLEPIEWIETNKNHRMLVYYSLGNFISYQKEAPRMLGGMANITITKDTDNTYISNAGITPIITHYTHGPKNFTIYKLSEYSQTLALIHGVSDIAQNGSISYQDTINLAKKILGSWYIQDNKSSLAK